jgi:hypothetical protein
MEYYLVVVGVIFTLVGIGVLVKRVLFLARAAHATGDIIEVIERPRRHKGRTRMYYHPKVEYTVTTGKQYSITGEVGSTSPQAFIVGSQMVVAYDPNDPETAIAKNAVSLWGLPICLLIMGIGALYGGLKGIVNV